MARILVIEDDDQVRATLRAILERLGHSVDEAPHGKAGVERFQLSHPDLVITDLLMPVMEGLETIGRIRQASPLAKIIAISGGGVVAGREYLRIAEKMGAVATLAKPISAGELELAVIRALGPAPPRTAGPRTFLVLDDDQTTRSLNRSLLEDEFPDSTVIECGSTEDALTASRGRHLDAVITDHHLGQSNGVEFVQRLRVQGVGCPIIMVTGSSDPAVHQRAYQAGAARVFSGSDLDFTAFLHGLWEKP